MHDFRLDEGVATMTGFSGTGAWVRRSAGAALATVALAALALLSRVAWESSTPDAAELRLSWRIPAPTSRQCRSPTEEELRDVLPHMRPQTVCDDEAIPFRLTIMLDGEALHSEPVVRSGRRVRTITVYRRFPVSPGSHDLDVAFVPEPRAAADVRAADRDSEVSAAAMTLSARVEVGPRGVILVSRDDDGRLVVGGRSMP